MTKLHGYSLSDLDNMIPYEREVYISLLQQWLEEKEKEQGNRQ